MTPSKFWLTVSLAGLGSLGAAAGALASPDSGTWQKHEYSFVSMGFTSTYSCDGLADKLKVLLLAAGARKDAIARSGACPNGFGRPDVFARADLTFFTLGDPTAASNTAEPTVPAVWRPVTFAARKPRELGTGDCELVEQFVNQVLPLFTTRKVANRTTCVPHQLSGSVIDLRFDSLSPAASTSSSPGHKPAAAP